MVAFILINLLVSIVDLPAIDKENEDSIDDYFYYLIPSFIAIGVIVESQKIEDCFHCFNRVPYI